MTDLDSDQELRRLVDLYAGMEDAQLISLAEEGGSLTEEARQALRSELIRRKIDVRVDIEPISGDVLGFRRLVSVAHYLNPSEAQIARGVLETAGIESFLKSENMVRMAWSNLVGGVTLEVAKENFEEAQEILAQTARFEAELDDPDPSD